MNQHDQAYVYGFTTKLAQHGVSPAAFVRAAYASGDLDLVKVASLVKEAIDAHGIGMLGAIPVVGEITAGIGSGVRNDNSNLDAFGTANRAGLGQLAGATGGGLLGGVVGTQAGKLLGKGTGQWSFAGEPVSLRGKPVSKAGIIGAGAGALLGMSAGGYLGARSREERNESRKGLGVKAKRALGF